ncbi:MAG: helix-turn-helix transcriptional regulator [Clostridia bacterium]|nr:helix-turn-helix transcriptional regulator [Clostridia bacterium]
MNEYFGKNIKTLRKSKNLTQEQFADELGVSFQSVSRWENCITYPDVEMIPIIARFFGVSTDFLFGVPEEEKSEKFKDFMRELRELPENGAERAIEIIRLIRGNYDIRSTTKENRFGDLCESLYYSAVKKTKELTNELRKVAEIFFESDPGAVSKSCALGYYVDLEDESYISPLLDRYAASEYSLRDSLLYERYLYLDDFDNLEKVRQRKVFKSVVELFDGTSWKDWRAQNDVHFAFWKNDLFLDFLHRFTNETPTEDHPITCGLEPDVFMIQRITAGELCACYLAMLGRTEEALITLEDVVSLLEKGMALPHGAIIKSRSPAMQSFSMRVDTSGRWHKLEENEEDPHAIHEAWALTPEISYERLTSDPRWAWFNPIRKDLRFLALANRVKTLI